MINQIPKDLRARLALPWYLDILLKVLLKLTKFFNTYKYPRSHDPTVENIPNGLYGVYKSMYPITRAFKKSGLEEYFRKEHHKPATFLPDDFIEEKVVKFTAVGDLMKNPLIGQSKDKFYASIAADIFTADLSLANLESTLTLESIQQTTYQMGDTPKINATPEEYLAMKGHKGKQFTLFHLANNHILDRGYEGYETTIKRIEGDGILHFGTNKMAENQNTGLVLEENGIKFGFIGVTYSLNLRPFPEGKPYLVNYIHFHDPKVYPDLTLLETQIDACKTANCDLIVCSLHWGVEYEFFPTPRQVEIAHHLAEYGADLIICHHPHCIQPYEYYQTDRDSNRVVPILYSLGNLSANKSNPHVVLNLIAKMEIAKGTLAGISRTYIKSLNLIPVFQHEIESKKTRYLQIEYLKENINLEHEDKDYQQYIETMGKYADIVLGTNWRV